MTEKRISHKIIKNVLWNFVGQGWMIIVTFLTTPFIVRWLNVNLYGIYALTGVVVGYFSFLQLGVGGASVKYISEYLASKEHEKIRSTFWSCIFTHLFMGILGVWIISTASPVLVNSFFKIPSELKPTAIFTLRVASFGFLISMLISATDTVVRAVGRFDTLNHIRIIFGTLQIGVTVFILKFGYSLKEIIVSVVVVQTIALCVYWGFARKLLPEISAPLWDFNVTKKLLKFGGFLTISSIVSPILSNIEKIFLTALRTVSHLTYYSVPFSLMNNLVAIPSAFSSVLFPAFSFFHGTDEINVNKDLHYRSTLYLFLIYIFFALFFIVFGKSFLGAWIGDDFAQKSTKILTLLVIAGIINTIAYPSITLLIGMGKPNIPAVFHIIETILYVPTGYFLISKFGGVGAAAAWLLRVLVDTILLHKAACGLLNESVFEWYKKLAFRALPLAGVCILLLLLLKSFNLYIFNPLNLLGILFIFILYGYTVWRWGVDDFARSRIKEFFRGI